MPGPLAVFTSQLGTISETFVRRRVEDLLPGRTVVVARYSSHLALMLRSWLRRLLTSRWHVLTKTVLSQLLWPVIWLPLKLDRRPAEFEESAMLVGLSAAATEPA